METISADDLCQLFAEAWEKLGYAPSVKNPLFHLDEVILGRVKKQHANDPSPMPIGDVLKQTIYQFCHFALHTDRSVS